MHSNCKAVFELLCACCSSEYTSQLSHSSVDFWSRQPVFNLATLTGKLFCAVRPLQCLEKEKTEHISFANQTLESTAVWDCPFQFSALFFIAHNRKREKVLFFKAELFVGLFPEKASDFCNDALQMTNMMYFTPEQMLHQIYTRLSSHAGHGSLPVRELTHSSEAAESFHSLVIYVVFIWQRDLKVLCRGPLEWAHVCPPAKEDLAIPSSPKPTSFSSDYFWTQSSIPLSAMIYTSLKVFTSVVFPSMHGRAGSFFTLSPSYSLVSIWPCLLHWILWVTKAAWLTVSHVPCYPFHITFQHF